MDKELEKKELALLTEAKLRPYTVDTFKKYWTHEDDYKSKKAGPVNRIYIAVYSIWHKRLLARVFYFEEYMRYKKINRQLFEVQRQLAGMSACLRDSGCGPIGMHEDGRQVVLRPIVCMAW